jgi:hypothetical protein
MTSQNSRKMSQELKRVKRVSLIIVDVGTIEEIFFKKITIMKRHWEFHIKFSQNPV